MGLSLFFPAVRAVRVWRGPELSGRAGTIGGMRDLFSDLPPVIDTPPHLPEEALQDTRRAGKLARQFVRWCCSFGAGFRNSPDISNLRFWTQKTRLKLKATEEQDVLEAARGVFLKHIEHMMRKSDTAS
jgi:hypothetical protein